MTKEFAELWVEKYRPRRLSDMVLNSTTRKMFEHAIKTRNLTSCSFIGCAGSGKTTLAKLLATEFFADTLFIPCATEGGVETLRSKVKPFVSAYSDNLKVVILDELDSASAAQDSSFQKGLRNLIEQHTDTRFICTANYNKIIPAVLSRCPAIDIRYDAADVAKRIVDILHKEKIEVTAADVRVILSIVNAKFPDIRSAITTVQRQIKDNKFDANDVPEIISDSATLINQILVAINKQQTLADIRQHYIKTLGKAADYLNLASDIYVHVLEKNIVTKPDALQKLARSIYELNLVVDKEIGFFGFICMLYLSINAKLA